MPMAFFVLFNKKIPHPEHVQTGKDRKIVNILTCFRAFFLHRKTKMYSVLARRTSVLCILAKMTKSKMQKNG